MPGYLPEIGQLCWGQPWQEHIASPLLIAALRGIQSELDRVMWNRNQEEYESPFANTGNRFECEVFKAHAYSWDETVEQEFNFSWRDFRVSWYKYLGRGTSTNRPISNDEIEQMLEECLASLSSIEAADHAADIAEQEL